MMAAGRAAGARAPRRAGAGVVTVLMIAGAAAVLLLALFWGRQVNPDTAWYLVATRQWLNGARLYTDLVEINPPLNFYLTVPAILLADLTGMGDQNAQFVLLAAVLAVSLIWAGNILAQAPDLDATRRAVFLAGVALALVVPFIDGTAQREHMLLILILPWLIAHLVLPRPDGGGWGLARAVVAALGICLKHYFLAYPVAVTLWHVVRQRSLRPVVAPGNLVMLAVGVGYVLLVWLLHPEYFREIVPAAVLLYDDYGRSTAAVLLAFRPLTVALGLMLIVIAAARRPDISGLGLWAALIAAASFCYLVQWKGFPYHAMPIQAMIAMATTWVLVRAVSDRTLPMLAGLCAASFIAAALVLTPRPNPKVVLLTDALRDVGQVERLATLSTDMPSGPPVALNVGAEWTMRYPVLWQVPGAVVGLARTDCAAEPVICARLQAVEESNRRNIVDDLVTRRPDILIMEAAVPFVPGFTWESYLSPDPRYPDFRAAYRELSRNGGLTLLIRD